MSDMDDLKEKFFTLKEQDIILAKFTNNQEIIHQPCIIIYISSGNNKIYAMKTCKQKDIKAKSILKTKINYESSSDSTFYVELKSPVEITEENFLKIIGRLSDQEFNTLKKKIFSKSKDKKIADLFPFDRNILEYKNNLYDVIEYQNKYLLIKGEDNNNFYCYEISKSDKADFYINKEGYYIDLNSSITISKNEHYDVVKILTIYHLVTAKRRNKARCKRQNVAQEKMLAKNKIYDSHMKFAIKGDIILINDTKYIIFDSYKLYFKIYILYDINTPKNNILHKISINNITYKTDFNAFSIPQNDQYNIIDHANESQIKELINLRKKIKKVDTNYAKPLFRKDKNSIELNGNQKELLSKIIDLKFDEDEIFGTMIALDQDIAIDEVLSYIVQAEKQHCLTKETLIKKILEILQT